MLAALAVLLVPGSAGAARVRSAPAGAHSLLSSRQLWATIDVCGPADQPQVMGVRGSMPGDGAADEQMYMRFRAQFYDSGAARWRYLTGVADSGFVLVGSARGAVRQAGRSFVFQASSPKGHGISPRQRLRGVVDFQWRRAARVTHSTSRLTEAGHVSGASADPRNFSSAECLLG